MELRTISIYVLTKFICERELQPALHSSHRKPKVDAFRLITYYYKREQ